MTPNTPEEHRESIIEHFVRRFRDKYDAGQSEHGGQLWLKPVHALAVDETLDFIAYQFTQEFQRQKAVALLEQYLAGNGSAPPPEIKEALMWLKGDFGTEGS